MLNQINWLKQILIFCFFFFLIFLSDSFNLFADEINWTEVANTSNKTQFIDSSSIKYNNKGFLSVVTRYSEINPEDQKIITSSSYLMAVDCENRLFSKLPLNGELKQVKDWNNPANDKLIKKTIIESCSY